MLEGILAIFVLALSAPWLHRLTRNLTGWILAILPVGILAWILWQSAGGSEELSQSYPWISYLGLSLSFRLDGLAVFFSLLILGIGAFILIYAGAYLRGNPRQGSFFGLLLFFMGSMLGVVLSDHFILLFIFWELTSISSFLLIGFENEKETARDGALQALLVTGLGGLAMLAGLILLGQMSGGWELSQILSQPPLNGSEPLYLATMILILLGAATKSAQFPFHFWLPSAMAAPTPVSAYLHSATMVKAGVYLIARLTPVMGATLVWKNSVMILGGITMFVGAALALGNTDLKRLLAYSTISALGIMVMLLGGGNQLALQAALVFVLAHALYKGALFMVAGGVDHEAGTRQVTQLGGLWRRMPVTGTAALLAGASMVGLPPLFGFIAKEMFYETFLQQTFWLGLSVVSSVLLVAVTGMVVLEPFFGKFQAAKEKVHEGSLGLWLGPAILSLVALSLGFFPQWVGASLLTAAAGVVVGGPAPLHLKLWHGFNLILIWSLVTLASGFLLYGFRKPLRNILQGLKKFKTWGPDGMYFRSIKALLRIAGLQTRILQSGYLRYYLMLVIMTTVGLVGYTLWTRYDIVLPRLRGDLHPYEVLLMATIVLAALMSTVIRSRLGAVTALGVVGYGLALVFILYGAPDLAMTQILIETLVVILLVLSFYHMPDLPALGKKSSRLIAAGFGTVVGAMMSLLVLEAAQIHFSPYVWNFYAENSYVAAHGRNIVNVILVDFRALDTFGEVVVLTVAGLGVFALLKLKPKKGRGS